MKINVRCFSRLAESYDCDYRDAQVFELEGASTVGRAIKTVGIPEEKVKMVFVNGRLSGSEHELNDGDRIALVPPTGGM